MRAKEIIIYQFKSSILVLLFKTGHRFIKSGQASFSK